MTNSYSGGPTGSHSLLHQNQFASCSAVVQVLNYNIKLFQPLQQDQTPSPQTFNSSPPFISFGQIPFVTLFLYGKEICLREVPGKSKWKFKMAFAIRRPPPPPLMAQISRHFFTPLFSFAIESYIYETDFTLGTVKNITFKSSFK